jgi:hypothetical protein
VVVDVTGTPSVGTDADGNPALGLATARDGTAVQLRPLRRDERELVAGFFAGLSAESRRRRFLQPMPRLLRSLGVELAFRGGLVEGRQQLPTGGPDPTTTRETTWATGTSA